MAARPGPTAALGCQRLRALLQAWLSIRLHRQRFMLLRSLLAPLRAACSRARMAAEVGHLWFELISQWAGLSWIEKTQQLYTRREIPPVISACPLPEVASAYSRELTA